MNKSITKVSDIPQRDLIIGGVSLIFLIFVFTYPLYLDNKLDDNPIYTKGVVFEINIPLKGSWIVNYSFTVDDKRYRGSSPFYGSFQEIDLADTCYIFYEYGDPSNNRLVRLESDERYYKIKKPQK